MVSSKLAYYSCQSADSAGSLGAWRRASIQYYDARDAIETAFAAPLRRPYIFVGEEAPPTSRTQGKGFGQVWFTRLRGTKVLLSEKKMEAPRFVICF